MNISPRFLFATLWALLGGALLAFAVWWKPIVSAFAVAAPPLALLFAALLAVVVIIALVSRFGALRHLRSGKVFHWIRPGALVPLLLIFAAGVIITGCSDSSPPPPPSEPVATRDSIGFRTLRSYTMLSNAITFGTVTTNLTATQRGVARLTVGQPFSVTVYAGGTHATNTGLCSLQFSTSTDGTNFTTTKPFQATFTLNGITPVRDWIYFDTSTEVGATIWVRLDTVTNALANHVTGNLTNVVIWVPNS